MGTPVYQAGHGFRRGDPIRKDTTSEQWVAATGAWDAVVGTVTDRTTFEIHTEGVLEGLRDLVVGEITYAPDNATEVYRALTETTALLLPDVSATESSSSAATDGSGSDGSSDTVVNNITQQVTNVTETTIESNDEVAIRRCWMGV